MNNISKRTKYQLDMMDGLVPDTFVEQPTYEHRSTNDPHNSVFMNMYGPKAPLHDAHVQEYKKLQPIDLSIDAVLRRENYWREVKSGYVTALADVQIPKSTTGK
jgi:hypothetical protein